MLLGKLGQDLNTIRKSFMSGFICGGWGEIMNFEIIKREIS